MSLQGNYYAFISKTPLKPLAVAIENAGIPSFPVFVVVALLIVAGAGLLIFSLFSKHVVSQSFVVSVLSGGAPVGNASVRFLGANGVFLGSGLTDENGMAVFNGSGVLTVSVEKNGFQSVRAVVNSGLTSVSLKASSTPTSNSTVVTPSVQPNNTGSFASFVADSGGAPIVVAGVGGNFTLTVILLNNINYVDGVVSVFDNSTNALIGEGSTVGGSVVFDNSNSNMSVGESVYFSVSNGWSLTGVSPVVSLAEGDNNINLSVFTTTVLNSSVLSVFNSSDNASVSGASVWVFNLNGQIVFTGSTDSSGSIGFDLPVGSYYALVSASGFVNGIVQVFDAPVGLDVYLSSGESSSLSLNVFDENGYPVVNGTASIFEVVNGFSYLLSPPESIGYDGSAIFSGLPVNVSVLVSASVGGETGSNSTFLASGLNNASVFVFTNFGFVNVSAFDFLTGSALNFNASVVFDEGLLGNQTASCSGGAGGCLLDVEGGTWVVDVSSNGYFDGSAYVTVDVGFVSNASVPLASESSGQGVVLSGVYDYGKGDKKTNLFFNTPYTACFNVNGRNDSGLSGFYVSGNGVSFFAVNKSLGVTGAVSGCSGVKADFSSSNYSWLDLSSSGRGLNGLYCVGFTVPNNGLSYLNFSLGYRVYSVVRNSSGADSYFYVPFPASGFSGNECSLPVFNSFFNVFSPNDVVDNPLNSSEGVGALNISFSQTNMAFGAKPSTCGDSGSIYNCNDFQGLSGFTNPLIVNFSISANIFNDKNYVLLLKNVSSSILSVNLTSTGAVPSCSFSKGVDSCDVSGGLSDIVGNNGLIQGFAVVNLTGPPAAGLTVEFSNGSESINRSFSFGVSSVSSPIVSNPSSSGCGVSSFVNLTYNNSVYLNSGGSLSGWSTNCRPALMRVSDVFPGDALKVYVGGDCGSVLSGQNHFVDVSGPTGVNNCFSSSSQLQTDSLGNYIVVKFDPYNNNNNNNCPLKEVGNDPLVDSNGKVYSNVSSGFVISCGDHSYSVNGINSCSSIGLNQGDCYALNLTVNAYSTGEGLNFLPAMTKGYTYNATAQYTCTHHECHNDYGWTGTSCDTTGCAACLGSAVNLDNTFGTQTQNSITGATETGTSAEKIFTSNTEQALGTGNLNVGGCLTICSFPFISACTATTSSCDCKSHYRSFSAFENYYPLNPQLWVLVNNNQLDSNRVVDLNNTARSPLGIDFNGPGAAALGVNWSVYNGLSENGFDFNCKNGGAGSSVACGVSSILNSLNSNPLGLFDSYLSLDQNYTGSNGYNSASYNDSIFNNNPKGYENTLTGAGVSDYLTYADSLLLSTALWRNGLDPGAPLKYFQNNFSFVRVFKVDSNDSMVFNGKLTDANDVCPPVSELTNFLLTNNSIVKYLDFHRIPRGFYVVNYTYSIDANGNPVSDDNSHKGGWSVQSGALILNNSNYLNQNSIGFVNSNNVGCDESVVPSNLPLCGYVFSTNNIGTAGNKGLGNCILSSSAYAGSGGASGNLSGFFDKYSQYYQGQVVSGGGFYTSSLIPLNLSCDSADCSSAFQNYAPSNFAVFPPSIGSTASSSNTYSANIYNLLMFGVFDDAGDLLVPVPDYTGKNGMAFTPGSFSACVGGSSTLSNTVDCSNNPSTLPFPYFDGLGLH